MSFVSYVKKPVKIIFTRFPILDELSRRFVWRIVYRRLFFHEPEMKFFYNLPKEAIDVAVDVGAAMGSYCWILRRPAKRIYAFEPGRIHNKYLNQASFGTNIEIVRAAVGSQYGRVELFTPGAESTDRYCASVSTSNPVTQSSSAMVDEVDQLTLDGFFAEHLPAGRSIDFLKVDVEGYELEALKGATELLKSHKPLVLAEIEARHNANYKEVFDLLKGLGYSVFTFQSGGFKPFLEERIEHLQLTEDLEKRLHGGPSEHSNYVNNFVFQHPSSKIRVSA